MTVKKGETKQCDGGPIKAMACADGYVMCRRPGCIPFVLTVKEWDRLPPAKPVQAA